MKMTLKDQSALTNIRASVKSICDDIDESVSVALAMHGQDKSIEALTQILGHVEFLKVKLGIVE